MPHDSACLRCGVALAHDHLSRDHRCPPCEVAYFESRDRLHTGLWFTLGFVLPWLVFSWIAVAAELPPSVGKVRAMSTGVPLLDLAIMTTIVGVMLGKAAIAARRSLHRKEFDRVPVGALSSGRRAVP